jgi:nitrogen-specific signal transduction histidine kinase
LHSLYRVDQGEAKRFAISIRIDLAGNLPRITQSGCKDSKYWWTLPAEKADWIFDAFFTTKPQGSSMGLAISRSIIESHDGRLRATPNDGRGATFHFSLPTATETVEAPAAETWFVLAARACWSRWDGFTLT